MSLFFMPGSFVHTMSIPVNMDAICCGKATKVREPSNEHYPYALAVPSKQRAWPIRASSAQECAGEAPSGFSCATRHCTVKSSPPFVAVPITLEWGGVWEAIPVQNRNATKTWSQRVIWKYATRVRWVICRHIRITWSFSLSGIFLILCRNFVCPISNVALHRQNKYVSSDA